MQNNKFYAIIISMDYGFISVYIDDFTPCLKDNATGELIDTEVIRIKRSSFLLYFSKGNAML